MTRNHVGPIFGEDSSSLCDCCCLYDADYEIAGLPGGEILDESDARFMLAPYIGLINTEIKIYNKGTMNSG